jgi:hypothetical protein
VIFEETVHTLFFATKVLGFHPSVLAPQHSTKATQSLLGFHIVKMKIVLVGGWASCEAQSPPSWQTGIAICSNGKMSQ